MRKFGMFAAAAAITALMVPAMAVETLKDAFKGDFVVGAALNARQITGRDAKGDAIVLKEFNTISPENDLKWERIHPKLGGYDFSIADQYVEFGQRNNLYTVGHVLVWHAQTPKWVFENADGTPVSKDELFARVKEHIFTIVGRYKGKIKAWDVINEVVGDDGKMRQSLWYKIGGEELFVQAFKWAHEANPKAELTYNDYNIENPGKREEALALVKRLKAAGAPITTVGIQAHYTLAEPDLKLLDEAITKFSALGVKVALTELDIDVLPRPNMGATADVSLKFASDPKYNPYVNGLPDDVQAKLTERYAQVFAIAKAHKDVVNRITLWGVTDGDSWHNGWPIPGRTAYSLLFDRAGNPKPAVAAILKDAGK
ncbi:endo-1,4-beta-xylanase [Rhizomicrobium palustre]|uniref:Beta-xylanase n=1 Tax=Rhizomicrobium palustre TaxID=189966 RepID=A0A846MZS2_9PROT|nr:endo-1,4-beta-xylanase [Rhizomicrobium palustre]NIK88437.1 endo-1,4-beta-xylanase [Rhizomicrobium palustre]